MGPKKPKKTKAELEEEKLAREEEERKQRIIEDKRLAEEHERQRLEKLRIEEEYRQLRQSELDRLTIEAQDYFDNLEDRKQQLVAEEKKSNDAKHWIKFRDPNEDPDPSQESEMNTFITLARDLECHSLKDVMELVVALEKAAQAVQDVWCDSLSIHNTKTQKRTLQNLFELRELIIEKLDFATVHLLRFVDQQLNDRAELNVEETATDVTIGMWASFNDIRPIRKSVQFEKLGAQIDLPKQILQQDARFVFRMVRMPITVSNFEAYSGISPDLPIEEVELYQKLHAKYIVGDMFSFDILLAPPPALTIRAKKWTMRDKSSAATTIRKSPYPSSVASRMFLKVPDTVVMSDDLRVARWDEEHREWTEDGITDFQYSEANRMVQFYITTTGTFALIKSRTIDMPYKRWAITTTSVKIAPEMSPNGELIAKKDPFFEQRAQMAINTQRHEILIDITGADCILVKPDNTNFNDLVGKRFSPGALFWRLQRRGVNLLPTSFDETSMEAYGPKNEVLLKNVLEQISRMVGAMDVQSTSWNHQLSADQIGIHLKESTVYTCPLENYDFECILAEMDKISESFRNAPKLGEVPSSVKYTLVMGNEYGNRKLYSHVPRPNETTHIDLSKTMNNRATPEAMQRLRRINTRFTQNITVILSLIKAFSLCQ